MPDPSEFHEITWNGVAIAVSITRDWLSTGYHHIELRAEQPLPISTTGYRSQFIPVDKFEAFDSLEQLVRLWLDDAAKSKKWIKTQEERRQLKLF